MKDDIKENVVDAFERKLQDDSKFATNVEHLKRRDSRERRRRIALPWAVSLILLTGGLLLLTAFPEPGAFSRSGSLVVAVALFVGLDRSPQTKHDGFVRLMKKWTVIRPGQTDDYETPNGVLHDRINRMVAAYVLENWVDQREARVGRCSAWLAVLGTIVWGFGDTINFLPA